jgi:hypothetical protein
MEDEQKKRPPGRPKKSVDETGRKLTLYVAPDVEEWLRAQPESMSGAIARLVRNAMRKEQT